MATVASRIKRWIEVQAASGHAMVFAERPTFWGAMAPLLALSALLFTRDPRTNFIFDEQEALLANPFVNGTTLPWSELLHRDFWGLPATRSIGSYRPLPLLVWRLVAQASRGGHWLASRAFHRSDAFALQPWVFHWVNVVLHAAVGALVVVWVHKVTERRGLAWLAGTIFVGTAVVTEAVSGVVGLADVLGGAGVVLAMLAITEESLALVFLGVLGGAVVALFSKESGLVVVPLAALAGLLLPAAPARVPTVRASFVRGVVAGGAALLAFIAYVELRKRMFPSPTAPDLATPLGADASLAKRAARAFLLWYHQPALPHDPLNNPLVNADFPHRVGGALRVFFRGLVQVVVPWRLSGDYSFPQEPIPERVFFPESIAGIVALVALPLAALFATLRAWATPRAQRPPEPLLVALCLLFIPLSYLPVSNIPVLLPTVRAERFWYFPALATSVLLALLFARVHAAARARGQRVLVPLLVATFLGWQWGRARAHAFDYEDDLTFWAATRKAVPRSAKAHLNYSVMWGARGRLDIREEANRIALDLAPQWPMANVYLGDTLCRLHRPEDAWPHYVRGFELAPDDLGLIALGLQCLWDEGAAKAHTTELEDMGDRHRGSWLDFLAKDLVYNGDEHQGVDPKYRPRGYNEGPKD